jgi:Protein of unknown function (DUF2384)
MAMPNIIAQASAQPLDHYPYIFFLLGLVTVVIYGWQRFNEPSFPNRETLPRTVEPLRYLFLRLAYRRARFAYLAGLLALYVLLVLAGPSILAVIGAVGLKDFPQETWALLVALFVAGLAPNSNKWVNIIEDQLRRWVHAWFFVPDGIQRTVAVLEDARYLPPDGQLELVESTLREQLRGDLKGPPSTLRHRWTRATMLILSMGQMGAGSEHPLNQAAFGPFEDDFDAIVDTYKALKLDVEPFLCNPANDDDKKRALTKSVDRLLRRIYAYISWGIRYEANSEADVEEILGKLGFRVPHTGGHGLFNIVFPAALLVALTTMVFWIVVDAVTWMVGSSAPTMSQTVVYALTSAMAASVMYGGAVLIALDRRAAQIEQGDWHEDSWECLIPIAITAGLTTWFVIVVTTVLWKLPETWHSLTGLAGLATSPGIGDTAHNSTTAEWSFLPIKIATALPWLLAGAVVSAVVACSMSSDLRRTDESQRRRDAIVFAVALGLAAAFAQLIQTSISDFIFAEKDCPARWLIPVVGLGGFACGAVIGFVVPRACRVNIMAPTELAMAVVLQNLLDKAARNLGSEAAARDWVFTPNKALHGITPAEALQFKALATSVWTLLASEATRKHGKTVFDRRDESMPSFSGGRRVDDASVSLVPAHDNKVDA